MYFLIYNSSVILVQSEASSTSTNTTKGVIYFLKKSLQHNVSSVTSGGLIQVKTIHKAQRI